MMRDFNDLQFFTAERHPLRRAALRFSPRAQADVQSSRDYTGLLSLRIVEATARKP